MRIVDFILPHRRRRQPHPPTGWTLASLEYQPRIEQLEDRSVPATVTGVLAFDDPLLQDERLVADLGSVVVVFSEEMSTAGGSSGPNSVTNPANWQISRNGVLIPGGIASVGFAFNAAASQWEATATFDADTAAAGNQPLSDGNYVLTIRGTVQDAGGIALDGDGNATAGGDFARNFRIAHPAPVGAEFRANTYTTSSQEWPGVAMDGDGDFVVAWTSNLQDGVGMGIYAQRYDRLGNPAGTELRVSTYSRATSVAPGGYLIYAVGSPTVAMDGDGDFVVAWNSSDGSSSGIYAQRYDRLGNRVGAQFLVNSYTTSSQSNPSVATDGNGNFVVAWDSYGQDGSRWGVYAQRYDRLGNPVGAEFRVNSYTTEGQLEAHAAMDARGGFVVAWQGSGIHAQRYDPLGIALGGEFRVNAYTMDWDATLSVAVDADGDFVVAWASNDDVSDWDVHAQRYDRLGSPVGMAFRANTFTTRLQWFPSVAMDVDGDFAVVWMDDVQDAGGYGVYAQVYGTAGNGPPAVAGITPVIGSTVTTASFAVDVAFSEAVVGVDATDLVLSGAAAGGATVETATNVGGETWRFPVTGLVDGPLTVSLAPDPNDVEGLAGNDLQPAEWAYTVAVRRLTLGLGAATVAEGAGAGALVGTATRINGDMANPLVINLASSDTSEATVAAQVTILAGASSATFSISAVDDAVLDGTQTVTITASASGYVEGTATLAVRDDEAPVPLGPRGTVGQAGLAFTWQTLAGADRYDVWVDDVTAGRFPLVRDQNVAGTSWTPAATLTPGHNYRWWVRARNSEGQYSLWSAVQVFYISLASPGPIEPAGPVVPTRPTFRWDPVAGAARYEIWVDNLSTGQSAAVRQSTTDTWVVSPSALTPGQVYRWWVRGFDGSGYSGPWSGSRDFAISAPPALVGPTGVTRDPTPIFQWRAVAGAARYDLWVDDVTASRSQVLRNQSITTASWEPSISLDAGRTYRWWVRALDSAGQAGPWSAAASFLLTSASPEGATLDAAPLFQWDPVLGAVRYELWVDDVTSGMSRVLHAVASGTTWTPSSPLAAGHLYRWWVRGYDSAGLAGNWSRAYDVVIDPRLAPVLSGPLGSGTGGSPTFSWLPLTGAADYELWVEDAAAPGRAVIEQRGLVTTSYVSPAGLGSGRSYRWWVRGRTDSGSQGNWSRVGEFTVAASESGTNEPPPTNEPTLPEAVLPMAERVAGPPSTQYSVLSTQFAAAVPTDHGSAASALLVGQAFEPIVAAGLATRDEVVVQLGSAAMRAQSSDAANGLAHARAMDPRVLDRPRVDAVFDAPGPLAAGLLASAVPIAAARRPRRHGPPVPAPG